MRSLVSGPDGPAADHTAQELRNLETIRALRRAPVNGRGRFLAPGFRVHRRGMAHLAALGGGYDEHSIADRADEIEDMIAKGDRVWAVWTIRGTHTGPLFGIEPTGVQLEILEVGVWRLEDGLVAEAWFLADEYALAAGLGRHGADRQV